MHTADSAPEANAYESQSSGIIDMLEKLAGKFEDERSALEEEETTAKHSFEMLTADLTRTLDAAKGEREEKSVASTQQILPRHVNRNHLILQTARSCGPRRLRP